MGAPAAPAGWMPAGGAPAQAGGWTPGGPGGAVAGWPASPAGSRRRRAVNSAPDTLVLASAGAAVLGALLVIWACALPILESDGASISIFNSGRSGWYNLEPFAVILLALAAAAVIVGVMRNLVPSVLSLVAAGVLIGIGIQTVMMFAAWRFGGGDGAHGGPGGLVGILAGLLLIAAGVVNLMSKMRSADTVS
jgi:hypothetical protein